MCVDHCWLLNGYSIRKLHHQCCLMNWLGQTMKIQMNPMIMKGASRPHLALLTLQGFGLIQMPI